MAWPKGVPRKKKEETVVVSAVNTDPMIPSPPAVKKEKEVTVGPLPPSYVNEEREAVYKRYFETQVPEEQEPETVTPEAAEVEELKPETPEPAPAEAEYRQEKAETEPKAGEAEKKQEEKHKPTEDEIYRNLKAALKEEREKRKEETRRREALERQYAQTSFQPAQNPDYDWETLTKEVIALKTENENIKKVVNNFRTETQQERQISAINDLRQRIKNTNDKLSKEGFPGFELFINKVTEEVQRLAQEDEDNIVLYDNPTGWERIYKERIFPQAKALFSPAVQQDQIRQKIERKSNVVPLSSPSSIQKQDKSSSEDMSQEELRKEYLRLRGIL